MVDPTTSNKIYAIPTHGTDVDTWDAPLNSNFSILDKNFGGVLTKSLTNVNVNLTPAEQQNGIIRFTGVLTGNVIITFSALGSYFMIDNRTTGNFYVLLTTAFGGAENIAIPQGEVTYVMIDGTNVKFVGLDRPGTYWDYAGAAVPNWVGVCTVPPYLLCDGSTFSAVTYPYLNSILGSTTLPDLRGRARAYLDGGTGRITTAGSGIDGATRFSAGGAQNVVVAQANLPVVDFTVSVAGSVTMNPTMYTRSLVASPGTTPVFTDAANSLALSAFNTDVQNSGTPYPFTAAGTAPSGGSGTALTNMPPVTIGGITMIRAA